MLDMPKVSAVITTYNRSGLLPRAVNSVLAQTYDDYEIIIVDDCSTDNTQRVITKLTDSRIRHFRHEVNKGVSAARNTGIANARGEYIAFLDDDDEWLPTRLAKQSALMDAAPPKVGFVYGWMDVVYGPDGPREPYEYLTAEGNIFSEMICLRGNLNPTLLARASAVRDVGGFDESVIVAEDLEFVCRLSQKWEAINLPEVVYVYRKNHTSDRATNSQQLFVLDIKFLEQHIARYERELSKHPEGFAFVLRKLATAMMVKGDMSGSLHVFLRALKRAPMDTCRALIFNIRFALSILMRKFLRTRKARRL